MVPLLKGTVPFFCQNGCRSWRQRLGFSHQRQLQQLPAEAAPETGATAVPILLKQMLLLGSVAVGAHLCFLPPTRNDPISCSGRLCIVQVSYSLVASQRVDNYIGSIFHGHRHNVELQIVEAFHHITGDRPTLCHRCTRCKLSSIFGEY